MEPFSVAAAAVTLCPLLIQTAVQLQNIAKSIKYARRELEGLTDEMNMFATFYSQFMKVAEKKMDETKSTSSAKRRLMSWVKKAMSDFKKLYRRVDALSRDPKFEHSVTETVLAHFKWYLNKSHLKYLRYTLFVARQSMVGFTHMYRIEKLEELLANLRSGIAFEQKIKIEKEHGMPLEQYIRDLEEEVQQLRVQAALTKDITKEAIEKISSKQSRSQNEEYSKHTEQLLSFSRAVDRDIKRTLHRSSSSSRNSSLVSSSIKTEGSSRVGAPAKPARQYVRTQQRYSTVHQPQERPLPTGPNTVEHDAAKQKNAAQSIKVDPNHVPPLRVPTRGNDTPSPRLRPDANTHTPTELPKAPPKAPSEVPPQAPPIIRSESTKGEVRSPNEEVSEYEIEEDEQEIANDQATHPGYTKWRPLSAFSGTEPPQLRKKRQEASSSRERGRSKGKKGE